MRYGMISITNLSAKYIGKRIRVSEGTQNHTGMFSELTVYSRLIDNSQLWDREPEVLVYLEEISVVFTNGHIRVTEKATFEVLDK